MRLYVASTRRGRVIGGDVHHKTRDTSLGFARAQAKAQRHAARQQARKIIVMALAE